MLLAVLLVPQMRENEETEAKRAFFAVASSFPAVVGRPLPATLAVAGASGEHCPPVLSAALQVKVVPFPLFLFFVAASANGLRRKRHNKYSTATNALLLCTNDSFVGLRLCVRRDRSPMLRATPGKSRLTAPPSAPSSFADPAARRL
jgi:hypothetical protein